MKTEGILCVLQGLKTQSSAICASRTDGTDLNSFNKNQVIRTMDSFIEHGQARKSVRGMPWHQEPTKDVAIYDKPR